ncbi:MAG: hypothetical protein AB7G75_22315 [Candidatus Binatia bacterium]
MKCGQYHQGVRSFLLSGFTCLVLLPLAYAGSQPIINSVLASGSWEELPNSKIRNVCPNEPSIQGATGCSAVTAAWSSGAFDSTRNRLIVWGGGHNDYYGNELYAVDLNTNTVQRLTNPGLPPAPSSCTQGTPDCAWDSYYQQGCMQSIVNGTQPNSRHTYDSLVYLPNEDQLFAFGGSLACGFGFFGRDTWLFDFLTMQWQRMHPSGPIPRATPGIVTAYDPNTRKVYLHDLQYLYTYDPLTNSYQYFAESSKYGIDYHLTGVIDPKRKKFIMLGNQQAWVIDITPGILHTVQPLVTSGGAPIINSGYPGLAYDPVRDRIVAWNGGDTVYALDLDTLQWTAISSPGGPAAMQWGTYKRWAYSPASDLFVVVNAVDSNAFTFQFADAPPEPTANLSLTGTDTPDPVQVNGTLTYSFTVTNTGPSSATGVTFTDSLPSGVIFVSATPGQGSCSGTATISCTLGSLASGASATVTIVVTPTTSGAFSNTANTQGNEQDPEITNNTTTTTTTVSPLPPPSELFSLTVLVQNKGTVTSNPTGIRCPTDCSETYPSGTTVTLTARPDAGRKFIGWSGACTGTNICIVPMTKNQAVRAKFAK